MKSQLIFSFFVIIFSCFSATLFWFKFVCRLCSFHFTLHSILFQSVLRMWMPFTEWHKNREKNFRWKNELWTPLNYIQLDCDARFALSCKSLLRILFQQRRQTIAWLKKFILLKSLSLLKLPHIFVCFKTNILIVEGQRNFSTNSNFSNTRCFKVINLWWHTQSCLFAQFFAIFSQLFVTKPLTFASSIFVVVSWEKMLRWRKN